MATPGAAAGKTCVDRYDDGHCKVKPTSWGAGAHAEVRSLKWKHWGNRKTVGRGRIHYSPGGDGGPGIVKLRHLRACGNGPSQYTWIKIIFVDMPAYTYRYETSC